MSNNVLILDAGTTEKAASSTIIYPVLLRKN